MLKTFFRRPTVIALAATILLIVSCSCGSATQMPQYARSPEQMSEINSAVVALVRPSITLGLSSTTAAPEHQDVEVSSEEEAQSITYRIYCTGAFINEDTVLTAHHCIDDRHEAGQQVQVGTYDDYMDTQATFARRRWHYFDIIAVDPSNDLALLRLSAGESRAFDHGVLELATDDPRNGEFVFAMGHPRGLGWTLTHGVVSQATRVGNAASPGNDSATIFVQSSAQAYYGNSGGPLMNSRNQIIGVVSRGGPWHIVMSVHVRVIRPFICDSSPSLIESCSYSFLSAEEPSRATPSPPFEVTILGHQR